MGYSTDHRGIKHFTPDNTPDTLYIASHRIPHTLDAILGMIADHFGEPIDPTRFAIRSEHIHTSYLGHDAYNTSDYTDYLVVERL
jgi:hypothetical protein